MFPISTKKKLWQLNKIKWAMDMNLASDKKRLIVRFFNLTFQALSQFHSLIGIDKAAGIT